MAIYGCFYISHPGNSIDNTVYRICWLENLPQSIAEPGSLAELVQIHIIWKLQGPKAPASYK